MKKKYQPRLSKVYYCMSDGSTFSIYETGGALRKKTFELTENSKKNYGMLDMDTKNHTLWSVKKKAK